jgi:hypothetical protein
LPIRIDGLSAGNKWCVILHSFDPLGLNVKYQVFSGARQVGSWKVPISPDAPEAFFTVEIEDSDRDSLGHLSLRLATDQRQILHWWEDRGFIAALHALWIVKK